MGQFDSENKMCQWCNKALTALDYLSHSVCEKCYRKLVEAGLTDSQIFKPQIKKKNDPKQR